MEPRTPPSRLQKVLILEDNAVDAELIMHEIRASGFDPRFQRVATGVAYAAALDEHPDVIIADYALPRFSVQQALRVLQERGLDIPVIVVTGAVGEDVAVKCLKDGAADYLLKDRLGRLGQAVGRALEERTLREDTRRAEARLRRSEELHRLITENINDAVFLADLDGRFIFWNRRAEELTGYTGEELRERSIFSLMSDQEASGARQRLDAVKAGQEVSSVVERRIMRKDGTLVSVELNISTVHKDGEPVGRMGVWRDLTERKRLQEQLIQSEKLSAMGSLLAGVAHELNNPLSVVVGQAELLLRKAQAGEFAPRAEKIASAAGRCARIVKSFLSLARQQPPVRTWVALGQVVEDAIELLAYALRMDNVEVQLDIAPDVPAVAADPNQLHQVVVNLITNAHYAMRTIEGPRRLTLTVRHESPRGEVTLSVADSGPGIPAHIRDQIFEPFFTTKPEGQGTGMGLSICRGLVEAHGGTIRIESEPGQGATFHIVLPVSHTSSAGLEPAGSDRTPDVTGKTILVIEDETDIAEMLADMLVSAGHQVDVVQDGVSALRRIDERRYDLIVSDLRMPGLDGPALYRELERLRHPLRRRIVFLTGDALGADAGEFLRQADVVWLSKPFVPDEVQRVVAEIARRG